MESFAGVRPELTTFSMSGRGITVDVGSLQDRCFEEIVKRPDRTLTAAKVEGALFSKRARQLARRSVELSAAGFGKGVDTAGIRQRIITKLIEEGRGMAGSFPAPPAFLDSSFTFISLINSKIGDGFVRETLSKRCPKLRSVDFTGCFYIRDDSIEVLLERCPLIEELSLRNCRKLTDETLGHIVRAGKNLSALDVGGCFNVTGLGVDALCSTHPNISRFKELDVSGIAVTTDSLELICQRCESLEVFRIGFTDFTEPAFRKILPPILPRLRSLHVHWTAGISDAFLAWLGKSAPHLRDLNVFGCSAVTFDGVSDLLHERQETVNNDPKQKWRAIESINVRYTTLSKQDVETLQNAFQGTTIGQ